MKTRRYMLWGILFAAGIAVGYTVNEYFDNLPLQKTVLDLRIADKHGARLTNPLLECAEVPARNSTHYLSSLKDKISQYIDQSQKDGTISFASVYYRDLNNGPWLGVNESEEFFPASLLKLPLVMSFYWKAEDDPTIFNKEITYTPDASVTVQTQPFGPKQNVVAGKQYTVKELIRISLEESSNEAAVALANFAGIDQITSVYKDLGLKVPALNQDYNIDTHTYASFFRILYNATYLDRPASEEILGMLTQASFKDGLIAGVPAGTVVSHKFGSRQVDDSGKVQLHDCGIVYAKQNPYTLCIMTQGQDFNKLAQVIAGISKLVYDDVTVNE